jgi:protoheme IX farnesyltransferase
MTSTTAPARATRDVVKAYVGLTKPRIIELLLVTTVPTMVVAARGIPDVWLVLTTLLGGSLAAGSANTINSYLEADLDEVMERTSRRPLVTHSVPPRNALRFGVVLGVLSFAWLAATTNLLSAGLALTAIAVYVFVYTIGLKRRSTQNIVIGGAAGCFPVLIGWSAVTGSVELPAIVLFLIVFYWTPPHFWALAIRYADDYARAGVPMLPVVAGFAETARQILLYTIVMVAVTLVFGPIGGMGWIYLIAAVVLGGIFLLYAIRLVRSASEVVAMQLFRYSITYLGLLFTAMAVDAVVLGAASSS